LPRGTGRDKIHFVAVTVGEHGQKATLKVDQGVKGSERLHGHRDGIQESGIQRGGGFLNISERDWGERDS